ncbi:RNase P modulator RnpM [Chloroflexota bacterium]
MTTNKITPLKKSIPQRTCIACRDVKGKRELLRLVCTPSGSIEIDQTGRKPGRGAYVCYSSACMEKGIIGGSLEHSLKRKIGQDIRQKLIEHAKYGLEGAS